MEKRESEQPPNNRINIGLESETPNLYDYFRIVTLENLYGTESFFETCFFLISLLTILTILTIQ